MKKSKQIKEWVESLKAQTETLEAKSRITYWDLVNLEPDLFSIAKALTRIKGEELKNMKTIKELK